MVQNMGAVGAPRRVLVVDDSRAIQAIIRRILESEDMDPVQVRTASNGAEALDQVESFQPDLVLSDWHMPGGSGIEMLQTLRQMGHKDMAVGFITTETAADCMSQARSNGAAFVLHKPFEDRALRNAVAHCLRGGNNTPAPVPATARPAAVESVAQLQQLLFTHLGTRSYELNKSFEDAAWVEQCPQLVALYSSAGRNGAYALGLLDAAAVCLIGGMAAGSSPEEIRQARANARPTQAHVDNAKRFMLALAGQLRKRTATDVPAFNAAKLSSQPFDKLAALLERNNGRSDFELRLPGIGEGRISIFLT
ncbi:response regulator [Pelomonas sp. SE-A7]|uniref:response regulator n=1 Tax=Pelomonas sp. SE-A7 TaxID=3054953 RepID=UPI00259D2B96|nr:response regulator [Pelomonas sp. SE-A7]MDM4764723.1 response regulator [Pelomonas sp. SE-A7]